MNPNVKEVCAYEPSKPTYAEMLKNLENCPLKGKIKTFNVAVSGEAGYAKMHYDGITGSNPSHMHMMGFQRKT